MPSGGKKSAGLNDCLRPLTKGFPAKLPSPWLRDARPWWWWWRLLCLLLLLWWWWLLLPEAADDGSRSMDESEWCGDPGELTDGEPDEFLHSLSASSLDSLLDMLDGWWPPSRWWDGCDGWLKWKPRRIWWKAAAAAAAAAAEPPTSDSADELGDALFPPAEEPLPFKLLPLPLLLLLLLLLDAGDGEETVTGPCSCMRQCSLNQLDRRP